MPNANDLESERQTSCYAKPLADINHVDVGIIMAYENGELSEDDTIDMFQKLVNSGLAWRLQGHYGRAATALIQDGRVTDPKAKPRQFEVVRQTYVEGDEGVESCRHAKETLTIEARDWDDAEVQAAAMGGEAEVTAEIEQL